MWHTTKAEETKRWVAGYQIIRCEETDDYTGKTRRFWMLYNPITEQEDAGDICYRKVLEYAKTHPLR